MDPRVARTRTSLQEALLALARERPLDEIAVGDITGRAGINRSTFYQHYDDKEQLLTAALKSAVDRASAGIHTTRRDPLVPGTAPEMRLYLEHIAANATVYRQVLQSNRSSIVAAALRERIEELITSGLDASTALDEDDLPRDVLAAALSGMTIGIITAWLRRDPLPDAAVAARWLWRSLTRPAAPQT
ncbi:TetR/AcrR family transcriptional regulator [Verrucosispora sp. NA02020]|uniref:TetR/AcrR family transcriptional regulator n=1 Tax=Verrucosispora sp. NA02020 TaxID=2742132 RepID=UPI0015909EA9|nr:TetR/AcrR family transcriptional regulator [Verrucosispora sp. NA02020]QKW12590.1 TetR/AcrR family transcriptional regulator [Verrucosispora sp. NA02020]